MNDGTHHACSVQPIERGSLRRHALDGRPGKPIVSIRGWASTSEPAERSIDSRLHSDAQRDRSPLRTRSLCDRRRSRLERCAQDSALEASASRSSRPAHGRRSIQSRLPLHARINGRRFNVLLQSGEGYDPRFETLTGSVCLYGTWQSYRYFEEAAETVRCGDSALIRTGWSQSLLAGSYPAVEFSLPACAARGLSGASPVGHRPSMPSFLLLSGGPVHPRATGESADLCIFRRLALVSRASRDRRRGIGRRQRA